MSSRRHLSPDRGGDDHRLPGRFHRLSKNVSGGLIALSLAGLESLSLVGEAKCLKPTPPQAPAANPNGEVIRSYNAAVQQFNRDVETYNACVQAARQTYQEEYQKYLKCRLGNSCGACPTPPPPTW